MSQQNPYASPASERPIVAQLVDDEQGITIEYENTLADAIAFSLFHHAQSRFGKRQILTVRLTVVLATISVAGLLMMDRQSIHQYMPILVVMGLVDLIVWFLYPALHRRRLKQAVTQMYSEGRNRLFEGPRRLTLSPSYLVYSTPMSQSIIRWAAIEKVAASESHLFIYLTSVTAVTVPRGAFASAAEFDTFSSRASELVDSAATTVV